MRIKNEFVLQEVADEFIVVPVGDSANRLQGIIKLNETGAFLWNALMQSDLTQEALADALAAEFEIDIRIARNDVNSFMKKLIDFGCIE